jgi:sensor histidine kinase regulating citrate/malate metabolism
MGMSLSVRAIIPVALTVTGFVVVCCLLLYQVIKQDMVQDTVSHETALAQTVVRSTRYAMLKSDRETVQNIVTTVGAQQDVEQVRIFNKRGVIMFSSRTGEISRQVDRNSEGCIVCHAGPTPLATMGSMQQARRYKNERGEAILAITTPIYNEPECFNAACHVHPASQKILGTLDIGLSQKTLQASLSSLKGRMALFSLMILILTVAGVSAILRRSLFLPIQQLANYALLLTAGRKDAELPPLDDELETIGRTLHDFAQKSPDKESGKQT